MSIKELEEVLKQGAGDQLNFIEGAFDGLGMGRGEWAPLKRTAFGFGATAVVLWALRPEFAFLPDGTPRTNVLWAEEGDSEAATVDWIAASSLVGLGLGMLV